MGLKTEQEVYVSNYLLLEKLDRLKQKQSNFFIK